MAPLTLVLSLICLLFGGHVFAGSSIWQPALAPRNNTLASTPSRRYYYANKDTRVTDPHPWENRVIRYCFDSDAATQAARRRLKNYLRDARKIWTSKGFDSSFRIEEVNDNVCVSDRNNVLKVTYTAEDGDMATYVGFPYNVVMLSNQGPEMRLTDNIQMGMLDVVPNFAHELGHAWGLYHEHQNPKFWAGVAGADGSEVFGPGNPGGWNCANLKDYATAGKGLITQTITPPRHLWFV